MRVPISWLREYVSFDLPLPDLAERLAVASAEVERIEPRGIADTDGNLGAFVVGRVLEAAKHPNADRLQLCQVDTGDGDPRQIVCGAWNFGAGATVCIARPGAILPGGQELKKAKLRGEVSEGMILAEDELGLGPDHEGIIVLEHEHEPGTPLVDVLPISDAVLHVELTGNRPDLLSMYGIAREVAALLDAELGPPPGTDPAPEADEPVSIEIDDLHGCPRYIGRLFREVTIGPSPLWLRSRLDAAGMRAISNAVDITNYVMHALGSPLHVFDHDTLEGGRIGVRRATAGEEIVTLDGTTRRLVSSDLLITDQSRAVALAGVMGGLDTEVGDETTNVLLEAANFEPHGILRTSERLAMRSEASNRWEKGVDAHVAGQAAAFATQLLVELAGGSYRGGADVHERLPERPVTHLRPARTDAIIGLDIPAQEQSAALERLGFGVDATGDDWTVTVPTWRARDVSREIDLIEEVARVHGLERVPFTLPARREMFGRLTQAQRLRRLVEDVLVGAGYFEAYTWSLVSDDRAEDALRLPEPLSAEHAVLRTSLLRGLIEAVERNVDAGNERIALFEVARVYLPTGAQLPDERWRVGGITEGGFERAKGTVEALHRALQVELDVERADLDFLHPGKSATVESGWVGEVHPALLDGSWGAFELDLATLFDGIPERAHYVDVITYPAVRQDLAFVVDDGVPAGDVVAELRSAGAPELREAVVFDVYRGQQVPDGKKSIAIRVAFQSPDRTLTDDDARDLRDRVVQAAERRFGAVLRA